MAKFRTRGAGERPHQVTINRRNTSGTGLEPTPTYTADAVKRWAAIEPLSAKELLIREDSQIFSEVSHKITFAWCATPPTHADQILFGTRTFEIVGEPLNLAERNREIMCMAVERK